ncbi:MAG: thiolase family protein [Bdellovibrionota bacterium]
MRDAFIVGAVRTAMGRKKGMLSGVHPIDLATVSLNALAKQCNLDTEKTKQIDDVVMGCVTQTGEQGTNISRGAVLAAGWPIEVSGVAINRFCGSGQQAVNFAAQAVMSGAMDLVVGAGVESMSRAPMGADIGPPSKMLLSKYGLVPQGVSAEMIAEKWKLSRKDVDEFALNSQKKATAAMKAGKFDAEVVPFDVVVDEARAEQYKTHLAKFGRTMKSEKVGDDKVKVSFDSDEHIRPETTIDGLANLKAIFKPNGGVIHAGNSSGIVDGSAAVMIASGEKCKELGLKPRARIVATAVAGSEPVIMLTGPIPATQKCLKKAGMKIDQIDLYEVNEAFASVPLACGRDLGMDMNKMNVNGGAIALGHPLGMSGARLVGTLVYELERTNKRYGLSTMCIGFGMGITTIIERV